MSLRSLAETSLHVQRKHGLGGGFAQCVRNISACAEKTLWPMCPEVRSWKHLCMCRENSIVIQTEYFIVETSLHVQRKLYARPSPQSIVGNISACAEKTLVAWRVEAGNQKHLCMCRENYLARRGWRSLRETSLHVQRKLLPLETYPVPSGNISACAEKTETQHQVPCPSKKHLCMCRENLSMGSDSPIARETSLHVQRKHTKALE